MRDFTHYTYKKFLEAFKDRGFNFITIDDFFSENYDMSRPFIIVRHDVDRRADRALEMAKLENSMQIESTYYFRAIPTTFKPEIIRQIIELSHEIGYHYESLAQSRGDYHKAIENFQKNLDRFRELYPIKHIAMHGRPTSKWDSRALWSRYDYRDYGIVSEPYFDIDFNEILYITDASRKWNNRDTNRRDRVVSSFNFTFNSTQDIIDMLNRDKLPSKIMVNIHPEHWAKNIIEWYEILTIRTTKNYIKRVVLSS